MRIVTQFPSSSLAAGADTGAVQRPREDPREAVQELANRVLGALAVRLGDSRASAFIRPPPSYEAYTANALTMARFYAVDYPAALEFYRGSHRLDTTFVTALEGMAAALFNLDRVPSRARR